MPSGRPRRAVAAGNVIAARNRWTGPVPRLKLCKLSRLLQAVPSLLFAHDLFGKPLHSFLDQAPVAGNRHDPPAYSRDQSQFQRRSDQGTGGGAKPLDFAEGPEIVCTTLAEGPYGIESQADAESVVMPLRRLIESDNSAAAFVIACYSDPGLHVCREGTERPVFGIAECGVLTALTRAESFGVIAIAQRSIRRHIRYLRQMGLMDRLAGERPLGMSVAETASGTGTLAKMIEVGRALKDDDGAGAIVMGCAGMARLRTRAGGCTRHSRDRPGAGCCDHGTRRGAAFAALKQDEFWRSPCEHLDLPLPSGERSDCSAIRVRGQRSHQTS